MGKTSSKLTCDFGDDAAKCVTVAKGKFQTDADVAGWGVLIAFAAGSFTTLILCLILAVRQYLELFDFFGCCSGRSSRGEKATRKRRDRNLRWVEQVVQDLIISLSDQQIVTGLSLAISIRYSRGCDVSAYHYNIIANLILMTMTTHVSAILVLPEYFDNLLLATLRIVAITLIVVWSGLLFINQQTLNSNPVSFPTAIPELGVSLNPLDTVLGDLVKTTDNFRNAILGSVANGRLKREPMDT
ncbi:hypothetical protein Dda_1731 [Drechslerella dactyloides]|uniref:Uncharacterized protein n=1 Tax=Drechslerella dactyloides TaxID=74499 RepID=A0AAD6NMD6_DREDA|nr:hypothetical protein Dda_1731 [Drechslerella dactyloides]